MGSRIIFGEFQAADDGRAVYGRAQRDAAAGVCGRQ
jgi:hypothetical protein